MVNAFGQWIALTLSLTLGLWSADVRPTYAQGVEIDDLWSLREFAAYRAPIAVSQDGSRLAFVTRTPDLQQNRYNHAVFVMNAAEADSARPIAHAGGIVLGSIRGRRSGVAIDRVALWSPGDEWIAYLVGVDAYAELWCVRPNGRQAHRVSTVAEHVVEFSWASNGVLIYSTAISAQAIAARLADAEMYGFRADGTFEPIYDVAPRIDDASATATWGVDVSARRRTLRDAPDEPTQSSDARIVAFDPRFVSAESPDLVLETVHNGVVRRCLQAACRGELLAVWSADGNVVLFQRQTGHHGVDSELASWSLENDAVRSIHLSGARLSGCIYDRMWFYCLEDSPIQPQRLVRISARSGARQTLWDPNPHWRRLTLPRVERLDTTNSGGQESFAHLVYPLGYVADRAYPLVVVQYRSRGFLRGGTGGEHPIFPLSARGYFVLSVDRPEDFARARTMSTDEFLVAAELDGSEGAMKAAAIEHFIEHLESRGMIDPNRVGITGMSDGTETLFYMLLNSRRRFAAAVTSSSPPDPSAWALFSADFRSRRRQSGAMSPWSETDARWVEYWRRLSPIYRMDRMRTPILFNLSATETLPAMQLVARLQENGTPHDLYVYPGAYHNKWRPAQNRAAQTRAIAWLDLWLRDLDTPDVREPDRATRWRGLRDAARSNRVP